jgi:NADH-quinone oxidoreductase subunit M
MSLVWLLLIPLVGGVVAWWSERYGAGLPRYVSLGVIGLALCCLYLAFHGAGAASWSLVPDPANARDWPLYLKQPWIPRFGIAIELGLDGLSLLMVTLTLLLGLVAVSSSWNETRLRPGMFQANLLWTLAGVVGVFLALDLFLFFLFWEVMLVPMYLLIAVWGHENRGYAAMKFFIFTQASGLLMLVAILVTAWRAADGNAWSFSYADLLAAPMQGRAAMLSMLGFFIAFAVKLPAFPVHTWLPDAHTQAPTAGSVLLAGILLKTGAYGLLRFAIPLFPEASMQFAPVAMALGVAGVIYGAVLALGQSDFKRLVAYSSIAHMGFVLLGLYAWNALAVQGAVMQMVAHGVSTAALFTLVGALQGRLHTRDMGRMGGLWHDAPRMGAFAMFFALAALGLPGLGNFVAEFMVLAGLFQVQPWIAAAATLGLITGAIYALWMIQLAFQGAPDPARRMPDFNAREIATMTGMMLALVWLGLYPQPVLDLARPVLDSLDILVTASQPGPAAIAGTSP